MFLKVELFDIFHGDFEVHPGLRYQHLLPEARRHQLHRPQHELQRGRLPAGSLQVCESRYWTNFTVLSPLKEGLLLHRDVLPPVWAICSGQLDLIPDKPRGEALTYSLEMHSKLEDFRIISQESADLKNLS